MGPSATYLKYFQLNFKHKYMERHYSLTVLQIYSNILQLEDVFMEQKGSKGTGGRVTLQVSNIAYTMS